MLSKFTLYTSGNKALVSHPTTSHPAFAGALPPRRPPNEHMTTTAVQDHAQARAANRKPLYQLGHFYVTSLLPKLGQRMCHQKRAIRCSRAVCLRLHVLRLHVLPARAPATMARHSHQPGRVTSSHRSPAAHPARRHARRVCTSSAHAREAKARHSKQPGQSDAVTPREHLSSHEPQAPCEGTSAPCAHVTGACARS